MSNGAPLADDLRVELAVLAKVHGVRGAAALLGLSKETIARAIAGLGLRAGSRLMVAERLKAAGKAGAP